LDRVSILEVRIVKAVRLRQGQDLREVRLEERVAQVGDRRMPFERREREGRLDEIVLEGKAHRVAVAREGDRVFVWCDGGVYAFERVRGSRGSSGGEHAGGLVSPMPGRVRKTLVRPGDTVARGQVLLVLEAMKMEHSIRAPRDGVLKSLFVKEGDLVESGVELAEIESPPAGG
jgi:3-methylcrotonyl-CoA carboxylase alpha subunit